MVVSTVLMTVAGKTMCLSDRMTEDIDIMSP
jgi:hypothetical protein